LQDERANSTRKNIRFDNELLSKIESQLCGKPFGTWVQEACMAAVHTKNTVVHTTRKTGTHQAKPVAIKAKSNAVNSYASKLDLPSVITEELYIKIIQLNEQGLSSRKIEELLSISRSSIQRAIKVSRQ
jgi:hypothetical protein